MKKFPSSVPMGRNQVFKQGWEILCQTQFPRATFADAGGASDRAEVLKKCGSCSMTANEEAIWVSRVFLSFSDEQLWIPECLIK